jgi:hypothetical protein
MGKGFWEVSEKDQVKASLVLWVNCDLRQQPFGVRRNGNSS